MKGEPAEAESRCAPPTGEEGHIEPEGVCHVEAAGLVSGDLEGGGEAGRVWWGERVGSLARFEGVCPELFARGIFGSASYGYHGLANYGYSVGFMSRGGSISGFI